VSYFEVLSRRPPTEADENCKGNRTACKGAGFRTKYLPDTRYSRLFFE